MPIMYNLHSGGLKVPTAFMTLFAQEWPHSESYIVANRAALKKLRDVCDLVLCTGRPEAVTAFSDDGEGYLLCVVPVVSGHHTPPLFPHYYDYYERRIGCAGTIPVCDLVRSEDARRIAECVTF